jgi:hypothetical protein
MEATLGTTLKTIEDATRAKWAPCSRTELFAPLRAPQIHDSAAALGRHTGAKSVAALAHQFAWLIGPFHGIGLRCALNISASTRLARLIREPSPLVNVSGRRFFGIYRPVAGLYRPPDRKAWRLAGRPKNRPCSGCEDV